jgi:hypothetical protein
MVVRVESYMGIGVCLQRHMHALLMACSAPLVAVGGGRVSQAPPRTHTHLPKDICRRCIEKDRLSHEVGNGQGVKLQALGHVLPPLDTHNACIMYPYLLLPK